MSELLLEFFSEEIPALMQKQAEDGYKVIFTKTLEDQGISFDNIKVFIGPRRLTVYISGLPATILTKESEIKGPRTDASIQAIDGFCRSHNISRDKLSTTKVKDSTCYIYIKKSEEIDIRETLHNIIPEAIKQYVWKKSMYWGDYSIKWVRPLKNILCLFDNEILPIQFGHLVANNLTFGHRFISPTELEINNFVDYQEKLKNNYVILDRLERQELIWNTLCKEAKEHSLTIKEDTKLLEEVTGLVEFPVVMLGKMKDEFLKLPDEVLVASMRTHQKYFSVFDIRGNFAPYFLFVSNMKYDQKTIVAGNEKVLSARLSDAVYFYKRDIEKGLPSMREGLKALLFHAKLGTMYEKSMRITVNIAMIRKELREAFGTNNHDLQDAADVCKNDLVSEMVGEFPELQGIMASYYYLEQEGGNHKVAAIAIRDHYKPQGLGDCLPENMEGAIVALVDKCDSLVGLMLAGERATGSSDSHGLRRLAIGIIRLCVEYKRNVKYHIDNAIKGYAGESGHCERSEAISEGIDHQPQEIATLSTRARNDDMSKALRNDVMNFIEDRAKFYFKNEEYDIKIINAVIDFNKETNLSFIRTSLWNLQNFLSQEQGKNVLAVYKRVATILNDQKLTGEINENYFVSQYERELFKSFLETSKDINETLDDQKKLGEENVILSCKLSPLNNIIKPISNFFDNVMVKDEKLELAHNRLLLLKNIKDLFNKIVNFDALL